MCGYEKYPLLKPRVCGKGKKTSVTLLLELAEWALPAVAVKAMVPKSLLRHRCYGLGRLLFWKRSRFDLTLKWRLLLA